MLLDTRMPVMDGWAFAQASCNGPVPRVPAIMRAARDAAARAEGIDADGYIFKTFSLDELVTFIQQHVTLP